MFIPRLAYRVKSALLQLANQGTNRLQNSTYRKMSSHYRSGALKPKPDEMPFGLVAVFCAVIPGLFVGATISKNIANFLEENDLFVPADDDDDED